MVPKRKQNEGGKKELISSAGKRIHYNFQWGCKSMSFCIALVIGDEVRTWKRWWIDRHLFQPWYRFIFLSFVSLAAGVNELVAWLFSSSKWATVDPYYELHINYSAIRQQIIFALENNCAHYSNGRQIAKSLHSFSYDVCASFLLTQKHT